MLSEALSRWQASGVDMSALNDGIDVGIADLGRTSLALTYGNTIWADDNTVGWARYVDPMLGPPVGLHLQATSAPIEVRDVVLALGEWWPDVLMSNQPIVTLD